MNERETNSDFENVEAASDLPPADRTENNEAYDQSDDTAGFSDTSISTKELDELLDFSKTVFHDVSKTVQRIGDTHLQPYAETLARDNRIRPLKSMQLAVKGYLVEGYFNVDTMRRLQDLEDAARGGNREVAEQTQYLFSPDSAYKTSSHLETTGNMLDGKASDYVANDEASYTDVPKNFVNGLASIRQAGTLFTELGDGLNVYFKADNEISVAFRTLSDRLSRIPLTFDEDALLSIRNAVNEIVGSIEDSDRRRDKVSTLAGEIRTVAGRIEDAAQ